MTGYGRVPVEATTMKMLLLAAFLALSGCCAPTRCAPPPVDPCGHIGPTLTYRGIGVDGRPACQACGAGKCG